MANEPNNPEEQLKQYAAERRQQVPGEIHPATRNMLQGEVARTYGGQSEARPPMRMRWLPALAWIAILAAIPLFLMPRSPETKKAQPASPTKSEEVTLPTESKPGEAPIELSDTKTLVKPPMIAPAEVEAVATGASADQSKMREEVQPKVARDAVMQRTRSVEAAPQKVEARRAVADTTILPATATAAAGAAAPAPTAAEPAANNWRISFVNNSSTPQALNRFRYEQDGLRVRVVDELDGSVYPGRAQSNNTFHVAGMNKTLKQPIVFTGQVVNAVSTTTQSQQTQQALASSANASTQQQARAYESNVAALTNFINNSQDVRLQGQAQIGSLQYKVDAQAAPAK